MPIRITLSVQEVPPEKPDFWFFSGARCLRSPKVAGLRGIFTVNAPRSLPSFSDDEYRLVFLLMKQAGRGTHNAEARYGMNGFMQTIFTDCDKAISDLSERGYLTETSLDLALEHASAKELSALLAQYGLKKSGKKDELIKRAKASLPSPVLEEFKLSHLVFQPSFLGYALIKELYAERYYYEREALFHAMSGAFESAAVTIAEYWNRGAPQKQSELFASFKTKIELILGHRHPPIQPESAYSVLSFFPGGTLFVLQALLIEQNTSSDFSLEEGLFLDGLAE